MQAKTEQEWLDHFAEMRKPGGGLDQLKAGYEDMKRTSCTCDGTAHVRADHIAVVN